MVASKQTIFYKSSVSYPHDIKVAETVVDWPEEQLGENILDSHLETMTLEKQKHVDEYIHF